MSIVYATNTIGGTINANSTIPLTITRRKCNYYQLNGNGITITRPNYYKASGQITFSVTTAGLVELELLKDSTQIESAISEITATTDTTYTLNVSGVFRVLCNEGIPTIYLYNSGVEITLINASLTIED